ncbi:MAG: hypothetical protein K6E31_08970 [bacterium]|nr:hypothetical protein [bacterium]
MICKYCCKEINDETHHDCQNHGENTSSNENIPQNSVTPPPLPSSVNKNLSSSSGIKTLDNGTNNKHHTGIKYFYEIRKAIFVIGAIIFILSAFEVAKQFDIAGVRICNITSVGGRTLEEAYYDRLGTYVFPAIAKVIRGMGIFCGAVLYAMRHKA